MAGRTVRCNHCGALIEVLQLTPHVSCAHCGHQQWLEQQQSLQQYQQRVASDVQAAAEQRTNLAQYHEWQRRGNSSAVLLGVGLMVGLPVVVAMVGGALVLLGVLSNKQAPFISFAAVGAAMLGMLLYVITYVVRTRAGAVNVSAGATSIACPNCGADYGYQHGQAIGRCSYCDAALMPTETVVQAGLDAARAARRSAEMDRWRAERLTIASYGAGGSNMLGFFIFGMFPLLFGALAVGLSWQMLTGAEPYSHGVFAAWGAFAASTLGLLWGVSYVRGRTRALRQASEALAAQFQGRPIATLQELVNWLNHFWAAQYDNTLLRVPGTYGGAYGTFEGYSVAAECSASVQKYSRERVQLLVAAFIPGISDGAPVPQQLPPVADRHQQWLSAQGFRSVITSAGVNLIADRGAVKYIDGDLSRFAQLAPILHHGCELARALGAIPVPAIP